MYKQCLTNSQQPNGSSLFSTHTTPQNVLLIILAIPKSVMVLPTKTLGQERSEEQSEVV